MNSFLKGTMGLAIMAGLFAPDAVSAATPANKKAAPANKKAVPANKKGNQTKVLPKIISYAERENGVYKVGETIRFKVWFIRQKVKRYMDPADLRKVEIIPGQKIDYILTGDGGLKQEGTITSAKEPVIVEGKLTRPGFMLLTLTAKDKDGNKIERCAGAAVEPEKIRSVTKMPADFEQYWANEIRKLRARKPKITCVEAVKFYNDQNKNLVKIYDVRIEDGDVNATGILTIPLYTEGKKLPARITFGGASWIGSHPAVADAVYRQVMVFSMNIHDTKNYVRTNREKDELRKRPDIGGYQFKNIDDRDKYMPRKIFLRIVRSLDYLKSRPEWDGKTLIASGPSFGGCQTIVAAALDKDVTMAFPGAPAMCDHMGIFGGQRSGWPQLLSNSGVKQNLEKAKVNSAYFDAANMARLIQCPTVFSVGFIDPACPPTSVYAAYNNVPSRNKSMIHGVTAVHGINFRAGDNGAFSAGDSPMARETLIGNEMIVNGDFNYAVPGKKNAAGKMIPYAWQIRRGVAEVLTEKNVKFVRFGKGIQIHQNIYSLRRKACKVSVEIIARGKGTLALTLTGATVPVVREFKLADQWQTFKAEYSVKDKAYSLTAILTTTESADIDRISAKYEMK